MNRIDLTTEAGLRDASSRLSEDLRDTEREGWIRDLAGMFEWVGSSSQEVRATRDFQHRLWEENPVASAGQGRISLEQALDDSGFREWLARESMRPLPLDPAERVRFLEELNDSLIRKLEPYCRRTPHLKIFRALAVLYPGAFTTVGDRAALHRLYSAMGGPRGGSPVARHSWVLERLEAALGAPAEDPRSIAERVVLPWVLYSKYARDRDDDATSTPTTEPGFELVPMPASRRRRGLLQMRGGFDFLLSVLDFVQDGVTREELIDYLRSQSPESKLNTLGVQINSFQNEFGVIRRAQEGFVMSDRYVLSDRGSAVLESRDPDELSDWLLTHILGVDNALFALRVEGSLAAGELRNRVQEVNPGWTTTYAPGAILFWLRNLDVIQSSDDGQVSLSERGAAWAERIHWTPEVLPPVAPEPEVAEEPVRGGDEVSIPAFEEIFSVVAQAGHFDRALVAPLHAGLWANPRRHFAVLTGLSGSGKTLLARSYGKALSRVGEDHRVLTLPVQPGWYDPGALLGYVNPLQGESYASTAFLKFLLMAVRDRQRPHVVVLDEMNLSHPEQYMAPLLSAMETGGGIDLHSEGDFYDGVPSSLPYPSNLVLIGTVNMDETTHGLSDKVLDRAFVLEFWGVDLANYPRWGTRSLAEDEEAQVRQVLEGLIGALEPARLHFGWRTVDDVLEFLSAMKAQGGALPFADALDAVIASKVAPKLRGDDSPRVRKAMADCRQVLTERGLTGTASRVEDLISDLESTGSARFWR